MRPLNILDIVITIYNQENLIEQVLFGVFHNTTTPFNLILVFDGCTDQTQPVALKFIENHKPTLMRSLTTREAPNVYETKANNIGFKLAAEDYMITVQDDIVIREFGWERRLTHPLRTHDDVLAVTGRVAQDIKKIDADVLKYEHRAGRELKSLPRATFAVRDVINRGPIAFRMDYLRTLNYLDESYAPSDLDDADLSLRAWTQHNWRVGAYWINYESRPEWSKSLAADSTMDYLKSEKKNQVLIAHTHADYLTQGEKHTEDVHLPEKDIDYVTRNSPHLWLKQFLFQLSHLSVSDMLRITFTPLIALLKGIKKSVKHVTLLLLKKCGITNAEELGVKKALKKKFR